MNETIIRQILQGHELPHDEPRCSQCFAALEGARVVVCARRIYGNPGWELNSVWCIEHGPESPPETPHGQTVLADARLGMLGDVLNQTHTHALLAVEIVDHALDNDTDNGNDTDCAPIRVAEEDGGVAR